MAEVSQGAGWWLASDGMWYPPELAAPPPPPPPHAQARVDERTDFAQDPRSAEQQEAATVSAFEADAGVASSSTGTPGNNGSPLTSDAPLEDGRHGDIEGAADTGLWKSLIGEVSGGEGWWQGTDGRWYAPELYPSDRPRGDDWWRAQNGRWYAPIFSPDYKAPIGTPPGRQTTYPGGVAANPTARTNEAPSATSPRLSRQNAGPGVGEGVTTTPVPEHGLAPTTTDEPEKSRFCQNCGSKAPDRGTFCSKCGASILKLSSESSMRDEVSQRESATAGVPTTTALVRTSTPNESREILGPGPATPTPPPPPPGDPQTGPPVGAASTKTPLTKNPIVWGVAAVVVVLAAVGLVFGLGGGGSSGSDTPNGVMSAAAADLASSNWSGLCSLSPPSNQSVCRSELSELSGENLTINGVSYSITSSGAESATATLKFNACKSGTCAPATESGQLVKQNGKWYLSGNFGNTGNSDSGVGGNSGKSGSSSDKGSSGNSDNSGDSGNS